MKKFLAILLLTWCFTASVASAYAIEFPRFWNDDKNYPLIWHDSGIRAGYLNKNSIQIKVNDPPYYIITAQIVIVGKDYNSTDSTQFSDEETFGAASYWASHEPLGVSSCEFFYDEEEPDMRVKYQTDNWHYVGFNNSGSTILGRMLHVGEAVFYISQGRKFYGNYLSKYKDYNSKDYHYYDRFEDKFYSDLR